MSAFEAKIYPVQIKQHSNADAIELACIGGYQSLVQKGKYQTGQLVGYIPEDALVPDDVIEELGLTGRLAGKKKNRVKAIKLRGVVSQGLIYPITGNRLKHESHKEGDDVTTLLGLVKYEPPIPLHMRGDVMNLYGKTLKFDIENIKKHMYLFKEGVDVVYITEKLHGTWCCLGYYPGRGPIVTSKGMSAKGLGLKINEANETNLYVRVWKEYERRVMRLVENYGCPVYVLGEIFGRGVQDLHYAQQQPVFNAFDIYLGTPTQGAYMDAWSFYNVVNDVDIPCTPCLYHGSYTKRAIEELTNGKSFYDDQQIREGIVIKAGNEYNPDPEIGRRIVKSVSDEYLLRKGKTTEFQ